MTGLPGAIINRGSHLLVIAVSVLLLPACLSSLQPTPAPTAAALSPTAVSTATATTSATVLPTVTPTSTPLPPTLVIPAEFAKTFAEQLAALRQTQPALRVEQVPDVTTAQARWQNRQATWAIIAGFHPFSSARLLCAIPYVPIVHFSSPLDRMSSERLRSIYQGKDWSGPVLYSGDPATFQRVVASDLGAQVSAEPSWRAVVERVASDRTAIAFAPWSEVDARVKVLPLDGVSMAAGDPRALDHGDTWWLFGGPQPVPVIEADIAARLSCPTPKPVTFMATGDILMGWYVHEAYLKTEGPLYPFKHVRDILRSADITFADFENAIPGGLIDFTAFAFGAAPDAVNGLVDAGIDVVNLANNHMGDYGPQGVSNTLSILRQNGIGYIGAGRNRSEARSPWITTTKGITIAILGYNEIPPAAYMATENSPGTAWIDVDDVVTEIKRAKTLADFVIVALHMGEEYTAHPTAHQQDVARHVAEAGADLIIGDHAHVVQALAFYGHTFTTFSLGDFVYVQPGSPATGEALILRAVIDGKTLKQVDFIPVYIDRAQPAVISAVEAKLMMARVFDATRRIQGLPPLREQATPTRSSAVLPPAKAPLAPGLLASVALDGATSDIVLWSTTPVVAGKPRQPEMRLTADGLLNDAAVFSPDRRLVAYSSARSGNVEIYLANTDGSGLLNITNNAAWDDYPTWSPDGSKLAFSSNRDGPFKIYVMNADGSGLRRLTDGAAWDTTPAWSPDGSKIAFASDRAWRFQIFTINADGSGLRQITSHPHSSIFPAWSPDGRSLVYQSYRDQAVLQGDDAIQDRDFELFMSAADGSGLRQLTNNRSADIQPTWSPDGRQIAFASDRNGSYQIYVMDVATGGVTQLTHGAGEFVMPRYGVTGEHR